MKLHHVVVTILCTSTFSTIHYSQLVPHMQCVCTTQPFISFLLPCCTNAVYLPFLSLGTTSGVTTHQLARGDDAHSPPINISGGFPFANSTETVVYVSLQVHLCMGDGISKVQYSKVKKCLPSQIYTVDLESFIVTIFLWFA